MINILRSKFLLQHFLLDILKIVYIFVSKFRSSTNVKEVQITCFETPLSTASGFKTQPKIENLWEVCIAATRKTSKNYVWYFDWASNRKICKYFPEKYVNTSHYKSPKKLICSLWIFLSKICQFNITDIFPSMNSTCIPGIGIFFLNIFLPS